MGNARILIVEDDKNVAMLVKTILNMHGYGIAGIAMTGNEAVDVALETVPDLILMNIRLRGEIDGITAYGHIKKSSNIPVIFVSGYTDADIMARAMQHEPGGYLTKPFRAVTLLQMVEETLSNSGMK